MGGAARERSVRDPGRTGRGRSGVLELTVRPLAERPMGGIGFSLELVDRPEELRGPSFEQAVGGEAGDRRDRTAVAIPAWAARSSRLGHLDAGTRRVRGG